MKIRLCSTIARSSGIVLPRVYLLLHYVYLNLLTYDLRSKILVRKFTSENINKLAQPSSHSHDLCSTMTRTMPVIFTFGSIIVLRMLLCP